MKESFEKIADFLRDWVKDKILLSAIEKKKTYGVKNDDVHILLKW